MGHPRRKKRQSYPTQPPAATPGIRVHSINRECVVARYDFRITLEHDGVEFKCGVGVCISGYNRSFDRWIDRLFGQVYSQ